MQNLAKRRTNHHLIGTALLMVAASISGCTPALPRNASLSARLDSIAAQIQVRDAQNLAGIEVEPRLPQATALIVVPDEYRLQMLIRTGFRGRAVAPDIIESLAKMAALDLTTQADALVKSEIFGTNNVVVLNDTVRPDIGTADYLVWFQVRSLMPDDSGPWVGHWFVCRAGDARIGSAFTDPGTPPGTPRLESFVHSVRRAVDRLESKPIIPPGPQTPA